MAKIEVILKVEVDMDIDKIKDKDAVLETVYSHLYHNDNGIFDAEVVVSTLLSKRAVNFDKLVTLSAHNVDNGEVMSVEAPLRQAIVSLTEAVARRNDFTTAKEVNYYYGVPFNGEYDMVEEQVVEAIQNELTYL